MSIYEYDEERHMQFVREEGREEGEIRHLIKLICRKLSKNKNPDQIAEDLDEDLDAVLQICAAVEKHAPDYDIDKIFAGLTLNVP